MEEEFNILKQVGKEQPFKVPDGYFENLNARIMANIQQKNEKSPITMLFTTWRKCAAITAAACLVGIGAFVISSKHTNTEQNAITYTDFSNWSDEEIGNMMNLTMLDDYSLYEYITEDYEE